MKRLFTMLLILIMAFSLIACSAEEEDVALPENSDPETSTDTEDFDAASLLIGYSSYNTKFEYCENKENFFQQAVDKINAEKGYNWEVMYTDAENDTAKQADDINDLIAAGCDIIVMNPFTSDGCISACQAVLDAGITLFTVDRRPDDADVYTAFFGGDNYQSGIDAADFLAEKLGGKGYVAHIAGSAGSAACIERGGGFNDGIAAYGDIEVVAELAADWETELAVSVMEDILVNHPNVQAVYCENDAMAYGAVTACESAGRDDIIIVGCDGESQAFEWLATGSHPNFVATVVYPTCGQQVAEAILNWAEAGGIYNGEQENAIDMPIATAENISEFCGDDYKLFSNW